MQFGRGLIESVNKQLFRQFAEAVHCALAVGRNCTARVDRGIRRNW
jgi:hypothetical protein